MIEPVFQIKSEEVRPDYGRFVFEPLEPGYAATLGNSLRRVLLSSLPGAAVTFVKIAGVRHQFTTLSGLSEDIVELILNIKKLRLAYSGSKSEKITLEATGPGEVKASQIKCPPQVKIINKDLVLGHLADKKARLNVEMTVETGYGYSPADERKSDRLGVVPVDALYSPIVRVGYHVAATRVGRSANFEKLTLEIWTDGTIEAMEAIKEATKTLMAYFNQIISPKTVDEEKVEKEEGPSREILRLSLEELNLPTRIVNALEKNSIVTVKDLVSAPREELAKIKNLGTKSLKIVEAALADKGVSL